LKKIDLNKISKDVLDNYTSSVSYVEECIDENFEVIIDYISKIKGRVIITGIGKSAIIGMKISATLNSTGTPSIFLHGSDALHGDIGVATKNDVMICLSKSGSNTETVDLVKQIKKLGIKLIGITSDKNSFLAKNADYSIVNKIEREACPNNLAPTTSTSMQLLIGDLIAICLMSIKEFKSDYNSFGGNAYGLANTLTQTAFLRPNLKSKKVKKLYFSGQLTVPGPGVPPAIVSGKLVANIIKNEGIIW